MKQDETIKQFENFINDQLKNNSYVIKRFNLQQNLTGKILVQASPGGASGGNCWNDNPAVDYIENSDAIKTTISDAIVDATSYIFEEIGQSKSNVVNTASGIAQDIYYSEDAQYNESEYYGNYTTHNLYLIDMSDFFSKTLDEETFKLFQSALTNIKNVEDPLFQHNSLSEKHNVLTQQLAAFDASKTKDKEHIKNTLEKYQEIYDNFDVRTANVKNGLVKELTKLEKELEPFGGVIKPGKKKKNK